MLGQALTASVKAADAKEARAGAVLMGTACRIGIFIRSAEILRRVLAPSKGQGRCAEVRDGVIAIRRSANSIKAVVTFGFFRRSPHPSSAAACLKRRAIGGGAVTRQRSGAA